MAIKVTLVLVFLAITAVIGILCRKRAADVDSFVLGGRSVGPWLSAFAYGTSYFSAVIFVGYAGQFGWRFGLSATWIGIGNALIGCLLAWVLLGKRTRSMSQRLGTSTMPDFFGKRYGSKNLTIAASLIIFVFMIPYTASLYNGLARIFEMAFGIDYSICLIVMAVMTCIYVVAGGYFATAVNDFVQGIIMLVSIVAVIAAVLSGKGGFVAAVQQLAQVSDTGAAAGSFASIFGPAPLDLLGVVILTSLGTWGLPQMVHKFYAIKSEKAIRTGTVVSTGFALVVAGGAYFMGGFGRLFADRVDIAQGYDAVIPAMLQTLPDILIGIVVVLVLSASMSTLSSLVLTSSSTIALDMLKGNLKKDMSEKAQLLAMRILVVVFIAISVVIALIQHSGGLSFIAQLMGISWGAMAGAFLGPFVYGLYARRATRQAVWASFIFGVGFTVANMFWGFVGSPVNAGAIAIVASMVIVPVVSAFTQKAGVPSAQRLEEAFEGIGRREKPTARKRGKVAGSYR